MIKLRIATTNDAASLARIYEYYVNNTNITFEYLAPNEAEFASRIAHKLEKYPFIVAEESGNVIGYAYASEFRERAAYGWSCELSVYVDKAHIGKGVGKRLYAALIEILKCQNFVTLCAGITSPNEQSVALHEKFGFTHIGTMDMIGFKGGLWLDVMWYTKVLPAPKYPDPIIPFPLLDSATVNKILSQN